MATTVKLLKHQGLILQSPYIYKDIRYHFLVAGYASGKTSALGYCILKACKELQGKKDAEGHNPRIILGSKNLTFLMKTSVSNLEQTLQLTGTPYSFDKKNNIITVGTVEIYLIPLENPENIYGWSVAVAYLDELSELPPDICMEAIKSINDRVRQQIEGFRTPFIVSVSSAQGLDGQYMAMEHFKRNGMSYVLIRGETKDNVFLPKSYVENLYKIYNEKERKVYLEGHFLSVNSSLVFSDYDPVKNMLDVDLFDSLEDDDTVYIGQDFNCISGNVFIYTIKGKVKMKNIKEGDYVLTRKGYRKVLHKEYKGIKMVQEFNNKLVATSDHVAITPEGDIELCKAKEFYYLKEQDTKYLRGLRKALQNIFVLKKLLSKEENISGFQKALLSVQNILVVENDCFIETSMSFIMEKLRKEIISTTSLELMITDLKILKNLLRHSILSNTAMKEVVCKVQKVLNLSESITPQMKEKDIIQKFQGLIGQQENILVWLLALTVAESLMQKSVRLRDVQNVNISGTCIEKEELIKGLNDFVLFVENLLQVQAQQNIVLNTKVIGKDLIIRKKGKTKVYDIEVEGEHEFYANGILVHNCFGYAGVACVVKNGAIVVIKDYDIPDIRRAPEIFRYDFPTQKIVWIPDATATSMYTQFKKELRSKNIKVAYRKTNPLVQDRVFVINKLLYSQRMFTTPVAKEVEKSLLTHQFDPKTQAPMKGGKGAPDHISDAMGYAVYHIMCWCKELKDVYNVTLGRTRMHRTGSFGQEVDADYRLLSPAKIAFEVPDNVDKEQLS